ncbi:MAG: hypothetical protein AAF488_04020 [Planctomycetota bacterium]
MNPSLPTVTVRFARPPAMERTDSRTADAYWLGGTDPSAWLQVIDGWPVDPGSLRLVVTDHDGVLVLLPSGENVTPSAACARVLGSQGSLPTPLPYRRQDTTMFVPIDAELDPPLDGEALRSLIAGGSGRGCAPYAQFLITPRGASTVFDPDDALTVADLWQRPGRSGDRWDHARPGTRLRSRLNQVESERDANRSDPRSVFEQLEPAWDHELPDEPGEKEPKSWGEWVRTRVDDSALWFTRKLPRDVSSGEEPGFPW